MRKSVTFGAVMLMGMMLAACGNNSSTSKSSKSTSTSVSQKQHDKYYFDGKIADLNGAKIKITGVHFYDSASDLGYDKQEIVFDYQITNKSGKNINANSSWLAVFKAYQDGEELNIGNLPADTTQQILNNQTKTIKKGETVKCRIAYELNGSEKVILKATHNDKQIGKKSFKPDNFKEQEAATSENNNSESSSSSISSAQTSESNANSSTSTSSSDAVTIAGHTFHHTDFYGTDILVGDNGEGEAGEWAVNSPEVYGNESTKESVQNQLHSVYNNN